MHTIDITLDNYQLVLLGSLTRQTVTKDFERKSYALLTQKEHTLNLAKVIKADTAGLAWVLVMFEHAVKESIQLKITNIPTELMKLAKLTAVDSFLPFE